MNSSEKLGSEKVNYSERTVICCPAKIYSQTEKINSKEYAVWNCAFPHTFSLNFSVTTRNPWLIWFKDQPQYLFKINI